MHRPVFYRTRTLFDNLGEFVDWLLQVTYRRELATSVQYIVVGS